MTGRAMADDSLFIVIEGLDGSGKTSVAQQLHRSLSQTHPNQVALSYEPHDPSAAGLYIRHVLTQRVKTSPWALALAFALNRADHSHHLIEPFLSARRGRRIIICDRYRLSSLVYQSTGGLSMEDIYHLNRRVRQPDLTLFLSVSPHNCYARLRRRPNDRELFEKNLAARARKYRAGIALLRAKGETLIEIDANADFRQVFMRVLDALRAAGPAWLHIQPPLLLDETAPAPGDLLASSDADLLDWAAKLEPEAVPELTAAQLKRLFKAFLLAQGFGWGAKLDWAEAEAYELRGSLPLGIEQSGIALILESSQQSDRITHAIHHLLDRQMARDFIIVLDKGQPEPVQRFAPDGSLGGAAAVRILTLQALVDWLTEQNQQAGQNGA